MQRTNIYLADRQLALLRQLGARRGEPVAGLVRVAVDEWLERQGARAVSGDEWQQRFTTLLDRRTDVAASRPDQERQVTADVTDAVAEVRSERARASRR
jgi:hypothetical protein